MAAKQSANTYSGWVLSEEPQQAPRAELVEQPSNVANIAPDMDVHDPVTYGSLTADHALRQLHAQGIPVNFEQYIKIQDDAMKSAIEYQAHQREMAKSKAVEEFYKKQELQPGGIEEQKAKLATQAEETKKQLEQGPSATEAAAKGGNLPGGPRPGLIKAPSEQQQKDWPAYVEGFHNLKDLSKLFEKMATTTAGAGGPLQSVAGLTSKITNLTSPEARIYHSYVDSSLIPLAKSIMGDAATTAGKETVQEAMKEALPNEADTVATGAQKLYMFYARAVDKMQTERDFARKNGFDTSSIDTELNDAQSWLKSPDVQKYNPLNSSPLIQPGTSPEANKAMAQVQNTANAGTNPPVNAGPPVQPSGFAAPPDYGQPPPIVYKPIASDQGGAQGQPSAMVQGLVDLPGQIKKRLPQPGGPDDPSLVMPAGSQGQVTWGQ